MKKILLSIFSLIGLTSLAQTFPVGHMSINFKDASRTTSGYSISGGITTSTVNGRDIGTEVYYPATVAGNNQPVASGQFPVVVFGHGFVMGWDSYDNIYNQLASKGYIVLLPRTEGSASPTHAEFGTDLKFLANAGMNLNTTATPTALATFNGKVLQKSAIGGHSMGAGSSFLGAASNTSITCLFNFAAATTNPSSINSASLVTVPTLMISGARDCVADTTVQNSHYNALNTSTKFHVILKQLTHCDFGNGSNFNCTFGQGTTGCGNQVSNSLAFPRYMNYLQNFLDNQLKSDCAAGQRFMDSVNTSSSLRSGVKKLGSIVCITTGLNNNNDVLNTNIFPNPASDEITIKFSTELNEPSQIQLFDIAGRVVLEQPIAKNESTLNIEGIERGSYIIVFRQKQKVSYHKLIKQ